MESGMLMDYEAHTKGDSGEFRGGWLEELEIGGKDIGKKLVSKVDGLDSKKKVAAFVGHVQVQDYAFLRVIFAVSAREVDGDNAATKIASLIGAKQSQIDVKIKLGAKITTSAQGDREAIDDITIKGEVLNYGKLQLFDRGAFDLEGGHKLHQFEVVVAPEERTKMKVNLGGDGANDTWEFGPLSGG
jgi:hypothetical protein